MSSDNATRDVQGPERAMEPAADGPDTGDRGAADREELLDPVSDLCARLQDIARRTGEGSLRSKQEEAETTVTAARAQARAQDRAELARVRKEIEQRVDRELQTVRLEARSRIARARWSCLDTMLDEAERRVVDLRQSEPDRYLDALQRFLEDAAGRIPGGGGSARGNAPDIHLLRQRLDGSSDDASSTRTVAFEEADLDAGLVIASADGAVVCDHSLRERRRRMENELRLAAAEILFDAKGG